MKKIISLSVLAGAVVMLSACGTSTPQEQTKGQAQNQVQEKVQQVKENVEGTVTGTIKDLMMLGKKQKCTWETPEAKGVVYVDGNKVRTNVTIVRTKDIPAQMSNEMNSIDDGQWLYTWNEGAETGTKMKSSIIDEYNNESMIDETSVENEIMPDEMLNEQEMNYKCVKWMGSSSEFTPPKNVKFQDMSQMMQGIPGAMQNGQQPQQPQQMQQGIGDMIKACDLAPTPEEKAKCMEGLAEIKTQVAPQ